MAMSTEEQRKLFDQFYPCIVKKAKYHAGVIARSSHRFSEERDFVQELVLRAFLEIPKWQVQKSSFMTFISSVLAHDAIDFIRTLKAKKRNIVILSEEYSDFSALAENQLVDPNCELESLEEITSFIEELPVPVKSFCTMFFIENQSIVEIAKKMNLKNCTVRSLLRDAMRPYLERCHHAQ